VLWRTYPRGTRPNPAPLLLLVVVVLAWPAAASASSVPRSPGALIESWRLNQRSLAAALARWDKSGRPPEKLVAAAQYQQRVVRLLAVDPGLARRVESRVPAVTNDVAARDDLNTLARGTPPPKSRLRVVAAPPASRLLGWYREAQRRFSIRWQLLAAINFVESAFGRVGNASGAGAQGPMQFMPATWRAYGLGGNVHDLHDAILGAANYLAANGGAHNEQEALYQYNHSTLYVDAIRRYASQIARNRAAFYAYYCWRVYFRRG
jgi:membrane-bound lytic murein transglycosylase B